jgi:sulfate permease, SulP family
MSPSAARLKGVSSLEPLLYYFLRPVRLFRAYDRAHLRPDLIAGLTVAVVLLPQAIAFALIAELPPAMGLYAAIIGGIVGGLWGSSNQAHTGPTNAISLLVLSVLLSTAVPGTPEFIVAAGLMAVMVGIFQLALGLARLGALVNFVSHSVVVGFASGAAVLIAINQMRHLVGISFNAHGALETLRLTAVNLFAANIPTTALGVGTIIFIVILRRANPRLPGALLSMALASAVVWLFNLDEAGVAVIGQLPQGLPPLADLPLFDLEVIARLSTGALAVGAIGLVETSAIARAIATQTGQRLDSNQEFVGQGLANIAVGFFSGYPAAGSFSRSAVNYEARAQTGVAALFSSAFVLTAMFLLAPLAAYLPRAALAGVLLVTAYNMIDRGEIVRIWRGTRDDAMIMMVTFLGTIFLHIEFAVLAGILLSLAVYIMKTSVPIVHAVLPDDDFVHFRERRGKPHCPQLGILDIHGDLYFGAVHHVEEAILRHADAHPEQRFLLLRMHGVNQCDFSGVHMLENILHIYRERGGDIYVMRARRMVKDVMLACGFCDQLGMDNFLESDDAIGFLFHHILDPAVCIYECEVRAFRECQNLPKQIFPLTVLAHTVRPQRPITEISPVTLWRNLRQPIERRPLLIDVREPREFHQGHIMGAELIPLPELLTNGFNLPRDREITLVCRGGRRSHRAAAVLQERGYEQIVVLRGGMLAWEAAGLLEAVD